MQDSKQTPTLGIIGGGLLGLSLAYFLSSENFAITIIEKNDSLGGLAGGFKINGSSLEKYYHHIFKGDTAIQELMQELGLFEQLDWIPAKMGIYRNGKIYKFSHALDILSFSPLNIFQRLRLGFFSFYLQKLAKPEAFKNKTALAWCRQYFGGKICEVIWEPLLKSKFGSDYENISMTWLWARIKDRSSSRGLPWTDERLGYLNGSMQKLIDKLEQKLHERGVRIYKNCAILDFKQGGKEHTLTLRDSEGVVSKAHFNFIVATSTPRHFLKLFSPPEATIKAWNRIHFTGAICGVLVLKHSLIRDYWLSINDPTAPLVAVVEHTNLVGRAQFAGDTILYVGKYLKANDPQMQLAPEEFWQVTFKFLKKLNPEFNSDWVKAKYLNKTDVAQHLVTTDYQIPSMESGIKHIYFAHFAQIFPHDRGTNYAVAGGRELADKLIQAIK